LKTPRRRLPAGPESAGKIAELRARLAQAEEAIRAIRSGEVDTVVVTGKQGPQVFTLDGAEHVYRELIESMNEGALTLAADKTILFANQCFARMVNYPLEQVTGSSLRRFLSLADRGLLRSLFKRTVNAGSKIQVQLICRGGSLLPAQISIRQLKPTGADHATIGMVVTDMTESRRTEDRLRALTQRVVEVQEAERGRVALELHDNITQLLCALVFSSQTLATTLARRGGPHAGEAVALREGLGQAADEVERITRNLRPGVLEHLGLVSALRGTTNEFSERTRVSVRLSFVELTGRLSGAVELTLYRILQEALKNVEKHARARHVSVGLTEPHRFVRLKITDDGIGFSPAKKTVASKKRRSGLGLLGMRERAAYVGGILKVKSVRGGGTEIDVLVPLEPDAAAAA
jgi:two-component system NarL family sensor kinase